MKLELSISNFEKSSIFVKERLLKICSSASSLESLCNLFSEYSNDVLNHGQIALDEWIQVLTVIDDILAQSAKGIRRYGNITNFMEGSIDGSNSNNIHLKTTLIFLSSLLQNSRSKQFFLSIDNIGSLLYSQDLDILELCIKIILYYVLPTGTLQYHSSENDVKDYNELPQALQEELFVIFQGLCFNNPDGSLLQCLRCVNMHTNISSPEFHADIIVKPIQQQKGQTSPTPSTPPISVTLAMDVINSEVTESIEALYKAYTLGSEHLLSVHSAILAWKASHKAPLQLLRLRLLCLGALSRCRNLASRLHAFLSPGGDFLKDLIAIADSSSDVFTELQPTLGFDVAAIAVHTLLGLTDTYICTSAHRRSHRGASLLTELGLSGSVDSAAGQDAAWLSIVRSGISSLSSFLEAQPLNCEVRSSASETSVTDRTLVSADTPIPAAVLVLARAVLDFIAAACIIGQELMEVELVVNLQDIPTICSVLSLLQLLVPSAKTALTQVARSTAHTEVLLLINKCLITLGIYLSTGRTIATMGAFRENGGTELLSQLLEVYAECPLSVLKDAHDFPSLVLESGLSLLQQLLPAAGRGVIGSNGSAAQILRQPTFIALFKRSFRTTRSTVDIHICIALTDVVRTAIDTDPSFLAMFIQSDCLRHFSDAIASGEGSPLVRASRSGEKSMLLLAMRLTESMSITTEGRTLSRDFPLFVIDALIHTNHVLTKSSGLAQEDVQSLAKAFISIIRERRELRGTLIGRLSGVLISLCAQCKASRVAEPHDRSSGSMDSKRMQLLQKLTTVCTLLEAMGSDNRRGSSDMQREILTEEAIDAVISAFTCTLPTWQQMFAQLGCCSHSNLELFGFFPCAKGLTSLAKAAASTTPQAVLPLLFKAIDDCLGVLSNSKRILRGLSKSAAVASENELVALMKDMNTTPGSNRKARRSRGSSAGQVGSDVMILGVLDCIPDEFLAGREHSVKKDDSSEDISNQLDNQIWIFLSTIFQIEWLSSLVTSCLKPMSRMPGSDPRLIMTGKDVLRRLFAFYRSSMLEVSRFSASRWIDKPIGQSRSRRSLLKMFCESDDEERSRARSSNHYVMRVVSPTGALIRENCEIDGSRVVLLAPIGTVITAQERWVSTGGIIRYRCALGWLSEFRRDHQRDPIVELLDLTASEPSSSISDPSQASEQTSTLLTETLTMRECACVAMTKVHSALRNLAAQLSRSVVAEVPPSSRRQMAAAGMSTTALSEVAPLLGSSLTNTIEGFVKHASENLDEASMPISLAWFHEHISAPCGFGTLQEPALKDDKKGVSPDATKKLKSTTPVSSGKFKKGGKMSSGKSEKDFLTSSFVSSRANKNVTSDTDDDDAGKESVQVDSATMCLYFSDFIKYMLLPVVDHGGSPNTFLLRSFLAAGVFDSLIDHFLFCLAVFYDALEQNEFGGGGELATLDRSGRCALQTISLFLGFFRKLANRDALIRAPITKMMSEASGELLAMWPFQVHDLLYGLHSLLGSRLLPLFQRQKLKTFPPDIQRDWLALIGDLVHCLAMRLPDRVDRSPRRERVASSATGSVSSAGVGSGATVPDNAQDPRFRSPAVPDVGNRRLSSLQSYGTPGTESNPFLPPRSSRPTTEEPFQPNATLVQNLCDMGFQSDQVVSAIQTLRSNQVEAVMEYLFMRPVAPPQLRVMSGGGGTASQSHPLATTGATGSDDTLSGFDMSLLADAGEDADLLAAIRLSLAESPSGAATQADANVPSMFSSVEAEAKDEVENSPVSRASLVTGTQQTDSETLQMQRSDIAAEEKSDGVRDRNIGDMGRISSLLTPLFPTQTLEEMSRKSGEDERTDVGDGAVLAEKEEMEAHKQHLLDLAHAFVDNAVDTLLEMSNLGIEPSKWTDRPIRPIAVNICNFVVKLSSITNLSQTSLRPVSVAEAIFQRIYDFEPSLPSSVLCSNGILHLLLALLKTPGSRNNLLAGLSKSDVSHFTTNLLAILREVAYSDVSLKIFPSLLAPALLIIHEFCCTNIIVSKEQTQTDTVPGPSHSVIDMGGVSEEKSEMKLDESKDTYESSPMAVTDTSMAAKNGLDFKSSSNSKNLQILFSQLTARMSSMTFLRDDVYVQALDVITDLLRAARDADRKLDGNNCHALLLLLSALLAKDSLAERFTSSDGMQLVLAIPACASFPERSSMLSLVVQRLFETPVLLKSCMTKDIRLILKRESGGVDGMDLMDFMSVCNHLVSRDPSAFVAVAMNTLTVTKVSTSKGDVVKVRAIGQGEDDDRPLEVDECNRHFPDERVLRTLSHMIGHIVADEDTKSVWTAADALHAIADCVLALRGIPHLVAKFHLLGEGMVEDNFVSYLLTRFCSLDIDSALGTSASITESIQGAMRLLIALSAHRGCPRRVVLDSIIRTFRDCCVTSDVGTVSPITAGDNTSTTQLDSRFRTLSRLGRLVTLVASSCRSSKDISSEDKQSLAAGRQHISLDAMYHLISNGLSEIISTALAGIPIGNASANSAIAALLDPLEMITRPKLLFHLEKWTPKPAAHRTDDSKGQAEPTISLAATTETDFSPTSNPLDNSPMMGTRSENENVTEIDNSVMSYQIPMDMSMGASEVGLSYMNEEDEDEEDEDNDEEDNNEEEQDVEDDEVGDEDGADEEGEEEEDEEEEEEDEEDEDGDGINHPNQHFDDEDFEPEEEEDAMEPFAPEVLQPDDTEGDDDEDGGAASNHWVNPWELMASEPMDHHAADFDNNLIENPLDMMDDGGLDDPSLITPPRGRSMLGLHHSRFSFGGGGGDEMESFLQNLHDEDEDDGPESLLLGLLRRSGLASSSDLTALRNTRRRGWQMRVDPRVPNSFRGHNTRGVIPNGGRGLLGDVRGAGDPTFQLLATPGQRNDNLLPGGVDEALQVRNQPIHPLLLEGSYGQPSWPIPSSAPFRRDSWLPAQLRGGHGGGNIHRTLPPAEFGMDRYATMHPAELRMEMAQMEMDRRLLLRGEHDRMRQAMGLRPNGFVLPGADMPMAPSTGDSNTDVTPVTVHGIVGELLAEFCVVESSALPTSEVQEVQGQSATSTSTSGEGQDGVASTLNSVAVEADIPPVTALDSVSGERFTFLPPPVPPTVDGGFGATQSDAPIGEVSATNQGATDEPGTLPVADTEPASLELDRVPMESTTIEIDASVVIEDNSAGESKVEEFVESTPSTAVPSTENIDDIVTDTIEDAVSPTLPADPVTDTAAAEGGLVCPPGYDVEVFNSLPDFMQLEVIQEHQQQQQLQQQHQQQIQQQNLPSDEQRMLEMAVASGMDPEALAALPESIRQEIFQQVERENRLQTQQTETPADPALAQDMDNASFLVSLTPDLRAEVLLGSDAAFLATLPPSLQAEAQLLRERAASRWQHIDMAEEGAEAFNAAAPPGVRGPGDNRVREGVAAVEARPNGYMTLPGDDVQRPMAPAVVVATILRLMFLSTLPWPSRLLHRLLFNLTKHPGLRDCILRSILSLITGNRVSLAASPHLSPLPSTSPPVQNEGDIWQEVQSIIRSTPELPDSLIQQINSTGPGLRRGVGNGTSTSWPPVVVIHRLLAVLQHIAETNTSVTFEMLRPRDANGCSIPTDSNADSEEVMSEITQEVEPEGSSANSLLEMLVRLLPQPPFIDNPQELSQLVAVIDRLCCPLDAIPDDADNDDASEIERAPQPRQVRVPSVKMARDSLRCLCEVLLSDVCSKTVFENISSTIARLTRVPANREPLAIVMMDVVLEISVQCRGKLVSLIDRLNVSKETTARGLGLRMQTSTLTAVTAVVNTEAGAAGDGIRRPQGLLIVGEVGSKLYERLLQALSTLQSLAQRSGRRMSEMTAGEELADLWTSTDTCMTLLGEYIDREAAGTVRKPQSTLSAFLLRILPVVEAFFLVHAADVLSPPKMSSDNATLNTAGATEDRSVDASQGTQSELASRATEQTSLVPLPSIPGNIYRTSVAYNRINLSLWNDNVSESSSANTHTVVQLRSLHSFRSLSGLGFSRPHRLLNFVQLHQNVLNVLISMKPSLLEDSLSAIIRITQLRTHLAFDNKRAYFFAQLRKHASRAHSRSSRRTIGLQVRRDRVFEDSFHQLRMRTADELRGRLSVNFHGEEGVDAGGLTREWFLVLSRDIFNPNYALFTAASDGATFQPNPLSHINNNHLEYFKFIGRVIGKAIVDGQLMDAHFTRSFYKHLLGIAVDVSDMEATEPDYYKSLKQILEMPLEDLGLELTFSADTHTFGKYEVVDLIPNGRNVSVTDENKTEYVRLVAHHRMTTAIRAQIDSFLSGFHDLAPAELVSIFSPTELELLICGLPDVDIEDLQAHTDYHQFRESDEVVVWLWDTLRSFSREEKAMFLQFVTGTSKVPLEGFGNLQGMRGVQRFSVHRSHGESSALPSAHTCFNQLDLPPYKSQDELKEKLLLAIREGSEGFGFA